MIAPDPTMVFDTDKLVGKIIATPGPPGMGAAKLSLLFGNPLRKL
ncbi:MAG: hypothetical protein ACN4GR_06505 [Arenicellales bacterium]